MLYHYTYGHKLPSIAAVGALIPTGASIPAWERPALWFSSNPTFEPTALKPMLVEGRAVRVPFERLAQMIGAYRFVLDGQHAVAQWPAARKLIGIRHADAAKMESVGRRLGAIPSQWWATIDPVPLDVLALEVWRESRWQPADLADELAAGTQVVGLSAVGPRWA